MQPHLFLIGIYYIIREWVCILLPYIFVISFLSSNRFLPLDDSLLFLYLIHRISSSHCQTGQSRVALECHRQHLSSFLFDMHGQSGEGGVDVECLT